MIDTGKKNIVLIGMPGSGKSSVGRALSDLTDRAMFDCDALIENECGIKINEIFERFGQQYFRTVETRVVKGISKKENIIISCGGGVVLNDENMQALRDSGVVVWLKSDPKKIFDRIKNNPHRPLVSKKDGVDGIEKTYQIRKPLYERYSDFSIEADDLSIEDIAKMIVKRLVIN